MAHHMRELYAHFSTWCEVTNINMLEACDDQRSGVVALRQRLWCAFVQDCGRPWTTPPARSFDSTSPESFKSVRGCFKQAEHNRPMTKMLSRRILFSRRNPHDTDARLACVTHAQPHNGCVAWEEIAYTFGKQIVPTRKVVQIPSIAHFTTVSSLTEGCAGPMRRPLWT